MRDTEELEKEIRNKILAILAQVGKGEDNKNTVEETHLEASGMVKNQELVNEETTL